MAIFLTIESADPSFAYVMLIAWTFCKQMGVAELSCESPDSIAAV